MTDLLWAVQILVALSLIAIILVQHGKGADMGASFGGGSSQTLFGARGSATFLSRVTAILATVFFLTSLTLAYLSSHQGQPRSIAEIQKPLTAVEVPASTSAPKTVPVAPQTVPSVPKGS